MAQRSSYLPGTPCWTDLQTGDVPAAKAFYGRLFGWTFDDRPTPTGGTYAMALLGSDTVAAIAPRSPLLDEDTPASWSTYLAVDDVDAAVAAASSNGGTVLLAGEDIPGSGRMAFVADPTGAAVGLWQAAGHIGATRVNEPNTLVWNELTTTDLATALPFYRAVAGIEAVQTKLADEDYILLTVDGQNVGGALAPQLAGASNHWHSWFGVADAAATAATARQAGGTVIIEPMDLPVGTVAAIRDPQGAVFGVLQDPDPS